MQCQKMEAEVTKELAAKRKALVSTEKRMAKLEADRRELTAEVERLDMLEKSLKAVNEKLPAPKEKEYIYVPYYYPNTFTVPNTWPNNLPYYQQPWNNQTITYRDANGNVGTGTETITTNMPVTTTALNLTSGSNSLQ